MDPVNSEIMQFFVENVKRHLKETKQSITWLAFHTDIQRPNLRKILAYREWITLHQADAIAEAFRVDLAELLMPPKAHKTDSPREHEQSHKVQV